MEKLLMGGVSRRREQRFYDGENKEGDRSWGKGARIQGQVRKRWECYLQGPLLACVSVFRNLFFLKLIK